MKRTGHKQTKEKQTQVFCQIREGLLEAIELEKNCLVDRVPIDMGSDLSMDSPERFAKRLPEVTFIPAGSASRDAYGHRYGSELLELDDAMLNKLRQGQQLAVEINQGEYILFIQYRSEEKNIHEKCTLRQGR